jgi:hypothetical protein
VSGPQYPALPRWWRVTGRVHCPDAPDIAEEIAEWIETNWTTAL